MEQYIFYFIEKIAHYSSFFGISPNIWIYILPMLAPPMVLLVGVNRSGRTHFFRVMGAICITYLLLNLAVNHERILEFQNMLACLERHNYVEGSELVPAECESDLDGGDVATIFLLLFLGFLPAALYVGLWEGAWRLWNWRKIKELGDQFEGRYFSNAIIITPIVLLSLFICFVALSRMTAPSGHF